SPLHAGVRQRWLKDDLECWLRTRKLRRPSDDELVGGLDGDAVWGWALGGFERTEDGLDGSRNGDDEAENVESAAPDVTAIATAIARPFQAGVEVVLDLMTKLEVCCAAPALNLPLNLELHEGIV